MTDLPALVRRIASGDESALAELYDRTAAQVHGMCLRIVADAAAAEEVTLDVFLQAWNQAVAFDASRGTVEAWLLVIARSRALDRRRSDKARRDRELDASFDADRQPRESVSMVTDPAIADRRTRVLAALDRVSRDERAVIGCAFWLGMSHSEIAQHLGEPLGTVKSRIRSGLTKLRLSLLPLAAGGLS